MFNWFRNKTCSHVFEAKNIELTHIPELPKPKTRGYQEWWEYFDKVYDHDSIKKRIKCDCEKCGETFFAHCGLDLMKIGKLLFNYEQ